MAEEYNFFAFSINNSERFCIFANRFGYEPV